MKTKKLWTLLGLILSLGFFSCEDNTGDTTAVAITKVVVTPEGSTRSYNCDVVQQASFIENTNDSVEWDIADAALAKANVKVTATLNSTVFYNDQAIGADGIEINVTEPVQLIVKDNSGNAKTYMLNVVRATTASGDDMILKSSVFKGFPSNVISYDMTYFKDKFYAITASVDSTIEKYQLFSSSDGVNWEEILYQTDTVGVNFAEGQVRNYVIGGEGARLAVFNDRMYVLGGVRTQNVDIYGNPAESVLDKWRSYSTSDGLNFRTDTVNMTLLSATGDTINYSQIASCYMTTATLNNKLYFKNAYTYAFGGGQNAQIYASTENGKDWQRISPVNSDNAVNVASRLGDAFFSFKGKLRCIGGFVSYISDNYIQKTAYCSEDGINWTLASDTIDKVFGKLYGMKVVANENVAYMFGGERLLESNKREISNDIFRSYDGITWEKLETPSQYKGSRMPIVVLNKNSAWLFGGFKNASNSNWGYPSPTDELATDTWTILMK